jgi:predicted DNA-binding protein
MLIQRQPTAIKTLSVRMDIEAYEGIHELSKAINSSPSTLLRLAIADLIQKQKRLKARTLRELIQHEA